ncbi:hypothetical protein [Halobacterium noricense]|uniref:hypothetical protein n=1 Tax=Halobacterium noricense TaxID=223182 RepID=UPI001E46ED1F|nr:hypothetical protein [Halobacterium noricense]UHH26751.1 hypothetical protein LT974_07430 [Halobacterium noricense]
MPSTFAATGGVNELFVDALRYPIRDRTQLDGTAKCLVCLLLAGILLRIASRIWPDWAFLGPLVLAIVPAVGFFGLVGGVLSGAGFPDLLTRSTATFAWRLLAVSAVYLLLPVLAIVATGYVIGSGAVPAAIGGITAATLSTVALLLTIVCSYLLPAAAVTGIEEGVRAGLRREALRGTASGAYFLAWVGAMVLVVLSWSVVATVAARSLVAVVALAWFSYAHVAAAALLAEGVERTRYWQR